MFEKIVVGIDGSQMSERAVTLACDLAGKYAAELHLVHTPQSQAVALAMSGIAGYHAVTTTPSAEQMREASDKVLDRAKAIAKKNGQEAPQIHVGKGDPARAITQYAEKVGADLIVTGRRGLGSLGALVQGSTSQKITHLAKCACLSVV